MVAFSVGANHLYFIDMGAIVDYSINHLLYYNISSLLGHSPDCEGYYGKPRIYKN
jgi:hypothetical protein